MSLLISYGVNYPGAWRFCDFAIFLVFPSHPHSFFKFIQYQYFIKIDLLFRRAEYALDCVMLKSSLVNGHNEKQAPWNAMLTMLLR
jgi:hypothetical protein